MTKHRKDRRLPAERTGRGGYGDPPVQHQFKTGHSGHRKVDRRAVSMREKISERLRRRVSVNQGGRRQKMSTGDLLIEKALQRAFQDDGPMMRFLLREETRHEDRRQQAAPPPQEPRTKRPDVREVVFEVTDEQLRLVPYIMDELGRYLVPAPPEEEDEAARTTKEEQLAALRAARRGETEGHQVEDAPDDYPRARDSSDEEDGS